MQKLNKNSLIYRIYIGATHSPGRLIATIFLVYSASWVVLEPIVSLIPEAEQQLMGLNRFVFLVIFSLLAGLRIVARANRISIQFQNHSIVVEFDDLFATDDYKVIPVSRYMYELDVHPNSLQSQVIRRYRALPAGEEKYLNRLNSALQDKYHEVVPEPGRSEEQYFGLGTVTIIGNENSDQGEFVLLALTKTEKPGYIPDDNCSVTNLWIALEKLWEEVTPLLRERNINLPLLGSGATGILLEPNHLLALNVLAILNAILKSGRKITTGEIRIILHPHYIDLIDLQSFKRTWAQSQ
ncbi:MAG: DUF6430 domain-containing protein [Anaerolineae bacterium]|nr:DUF6430 domain-containing protein [Anaerolineae bacterium]